MAEESSAQVRFQMVGTRAAVLEGPVTEAIEQQLQAIESALESVPVELPRFRGHFMLL